jgi:AcrR family transcriptional regulator
MNVAVSTKPKPGRNSDRAYRTRLAITDAFVNLIEEGDLSPSMPDVANRAGVSLRSLYYHFRNAESLYESVIRRQEPLISRVLVSLDHVSPLRNRAHNLVAQRCEIYRQIAPLRRAVQLNADARDSLTIRTARRRLEYVLARHANETFAPELREAVTRAATLGVAREATHGRLRATRTRCLTAGDQRACCWRHAVSVFSMRHATVIGPVPPGIGVMAAATDCTSSKATSPMTPLSLVVMPTSITQAPGFTCSRRMLRA